MINETPDEWSRPLSNWFGHLFEPASQDEVDPDYEAELTNNNYEVDNE